MASSTAASLFVCLHIATLGVTGGGSSSSEKEACGWDYGNDGNSPCTADCHSEHRCGPDRWSTIAKNCDQYEHPAQSPVDIDTHHLYDGAYAGLDVMLFQVSDSCERAAVMVTPRTWVLKFDEPGCKNGFKLDFRYHGNEYEYTAEKMELRAPSEHKIDHAPADMEAQFYFYDDDGRKLVISVLMQAVPNHPGNSFLAAVSEKALYHESTVAQFPRGILNFVDNFMPSRGLKYEYYTYTGSTTVPPCTGKVKWIVLKAPVYIASQQATDYILSISQANQSKVNTGIRGLANSTARPIVDLGSRHISTFDQEFCYSRYCHNLFKTGSHLRYETAAWALLVLICFTILFERSVEATEDSLNKFSTAPALFEKARAELSILGVVSFIFLSIKSECSTVIFKDENWIIASEYAHILLFLSGIFYVGLNLLTLQMAYWGSQRFCKYSLITGEELIEKIKGEHITEVVGWNRNSFRLAIVWIADVVIGGRSEFHDFGFGVWKNWFIKYYHLPPNLDIVKYIKLNISNIWVERNMHLKTTPWVVSFLFVVAVLFTARVDPDRVLFLPMFGCLELLAVMHARFCCHTTFIKVMRHLPVTKLLRRLGMHLKNDEKEVADKGMRSCKDGQVLIKILTNGTDKDAGDPSQSGNRGGRKSRTSIPKIFGKTVARRMALTTRDQVKRTEHRLSLDHHKRAELAAALTTRGYASGINQHVQEHSKKKEHRYEKLQRVSISEMDRDLKAGDFVQVTSYSTYDGEIARVIVPKNDSGKVEVVRQLNLETLEVDESVLMFVTEKIELGMNVKVDDRVRVTKPGRQRGRIAKVIDPHWNHLVKVKMETDDLTEGATKSYSAEHLELVDDDDNPINAIRPDAAAGNDAGNPVNATKPDAVAANDAGNPVDRTKPRTLSEGNKIFDQFLKKSALRMIPEANGAGGQETRFRRIRSSPDGIRRDLAQKRSVVGVALSRPKLKSQNSAPTTELQDISSDPSRRFSLPARPSMFRKRRSAIPTLATLSRKSPMTWSTARFGRRSINVHDIYKHAKLELAKHWWPFGSPWYIQTVLSSSLLVSCFYMSLYVLTYSELITKRDNGTPSGNHFLCLLPQILLIFFVIPGLLVQQTILECIISPDPKVMRKLLEWMERKNKYRQDIVENLSCSLDKSLLAKNSAIEVSRAFSFVLQHGSKRKERINYDEFQKAWKHMNRNNPAFDDSKGISCGKDTYNLFNIMDRDRQGHVEAADLLRLTTEEKIERVTDFLFGKGRRSTQEITMREFDFLVNMQKHSMTKSGMFSDEAADSTMEECRQSFKGWRQVLMSKGDKMGVKEVQEWLGRWLEGNKEETATILRLCFIAPLRIGPMLKQEDEHGERRTALANKIMDGIVKDMYIEWYPDHGAPRYRVYMLDAEMCKKIEETEKNQRNTHSSAQLDRLIETAKVPFGDGEDSNAWSGKLILDAYWTVLDRYRPSNEELLFKSTNESVIQIGHINDVLIQGDGDATLYTTLKISGDRTTSEISPVIMRKTNMHTANARDLVSDAVTNGWIEPLDYSYSDDPWAKSKRVLIGTDPLSSIRAGRTEEEGAKNPRAPGKEERSPSLKVRVRRVGAPDNGLGEAPRCTSFI